MLNVHNIGGAHSVLAKAALTANLKDPYVLEITNLTQKTPLRMTIAQAKALLEALPALILAVEEG